jgi:hypothetical protein
MPDDDCDSKDPGNEWEYVGTGQAGAGVKAAAAEAEKATAEAAARAAVKRYGRYWGQGNGGEGCYDGCYDGPNALEYGKLTCFPTRTMEVLQHHDSPWQPMDIALSPINLFFNLKLPNFINHYIARPLMLMQQRNLGSNTMNVGI